MPCEHVKFADGSSAIICSDRRTAKQCCSCGRACDFLCDWKVASRKSGTCDRPICRTHVLKSDRRSISARNTRRPGKNGSASTRRRSQSRRSRKAYFRRRGDRPNR
jgi:hypothetical protein